MYSALKRNVLGMPLIKPRSTATSSIKIIGQPELKSNETAPKTSSLCVKLFQEMGAEVSILDIDVAHRVSTRKESEGPKPVICEFVRHLAKGKVMQVRQRASQVNPTKIGLSTDNELGGVRIFDHLTPKKRNLLFKAKKFKEQNHNRFCWAKNSTIYLRKDEGSGAIKILDTETHKLIKTKKYPKNTLRQ